MRITLLASLLLGLFSSNVCAQEIEPKTQPIGPEAVHFAADHITYAPPIIQASGNVLVEYEGRSLRTPFLRYNRQTDEIDAQQSIFLEDEFGNRYFADSATFHRTLETGTIQNVSATTIDNAYFSADSAQRQSDTRYVLENARYSPCHACIDREKRIPIWQISADKIVFDQAEEDITYKDATFDFLGIPVLYTPYFRHPTPSAKRRSGFLVPEYSQTSTLGTTVKIPYYMNIKPHMDITAIPIITSKEGLILSGEFRHLTPYGQYTFFASSTYPEARGLTGIPTSGHEFRGHIEGRGRFSLPQNWYVGFDGKRATDDTYLRRYQFGSEDLLTSVGYAERLWNRNYIGTKMISFQGLNVDDDPDATPWIAPLIETHIEKDTTLLHTPITFYSQLNMMQLSRRIGTDSYRLAAAHGARWNHTTSYGLMLEADAHLYTDLYAINDFTDRNGVIQDGIEERILPAFALEAAYPLIRSSKNMTTIVTPKISAIISEHKDNFNQSIPNEDSLATELNHINLFNHSRFYGVDAREATSKLTYGLDLYTHYGPWTMDGFIGQSYYHDTDALGLSSNHHSDIVGQVGLEYTELGRLSYRFLMDEENGHIHKHELDGEITHHRLKARVSYVHLNERQGNATIEEIVGGLSYRMHENWSIYGSARRNLETQNWINNRAGIIYDNDCFRLDLGWHRTFVRDRDIKPSTGVTAKFTLKSLGKE